MSSTANSLFVRTLANALIKSLIENNLPRVIFLLVHRRSNHEYSTLTSFRSSGTFPEYNETTVIHALTGWLPEPIPLK